MVANGCGAVTNAQRCSCGIYLDEMNMIVQLGVSQLQSDTL